MSRGILYIATGDQYINEAKVSARSVRTHMPDTDIALITDEAVESSLFDTIQDAGQLKADFSSSNLKAEMSPFDRTLFLDTDTYLTENVSELFDILDDYDIAVAPTLSEEHVPGVPAPRTQYNTGVISYQSNKQTRQLFNLWNKIYQEWREERGDIQNQGAFLRAVYESDVDLFTLSVNYNVRLFTPNALHGSAKIIHGRHPTGIDNAARLINKSSRFRAVYRNSYTFRSNAFKIVEDASPRFHLEKSISERGLKKTLLDAPRYLKERLL